MSLLRELHRTPNSLGSRRPCCAATRHEEKYPLGLKGRGPTGGRKPGAKGGGGDPWAKGVPQN